MTRISGSYDKHLGREGHGSIMRCSMLRWANRACAVIALLSLVSMAAPVIVAHAAPDPIAAPIAEMVARVSPAVVTVITIRPAAPEEPGPGATVANTTASAGPSVGVSGGTSKAEGSGYVIDPAGFIGTNKHVVDGAMSVFVETADGERYTATVVGTPNGADMALLKIDAGRQLPFVRFGNSDEVRVGDRVFAIGSPLGFENTVTSGIISALNRDIMESPFDDYLQTDAAINHGNSGGALFNMSGEVIGMTSVIFSPTTGSIGLGFAIPSSSLQFVFDRLMKTGEVRAGMLPIHAQNITWTLGQALGAPDLRGALVTSVQDDAGKMLQGKIKPGDIIRTFNGRPVLDPRDLARMAAKTPIGSDAVLERGRDGVIETVHVTIHAWPEAKPIVLTDDDRRALGLDLISVNAENGAPIVTVASVDPSGTAANSGIQKGDQVLQVQETPVSDAAQTLHLISAQSSLKRHFAAVLVEHDKKRLWLSLAIPE